MSCGEWKRGDICRRGVGERFRNCAMGRGLWGEGIGVWFGGEELDVLTMRGRGGGTRMCAMGRGRGAWCG